MLEVVYYSVGGNTREVAEAVANRLGGVAKDIQSIDKLNENSLVFIGTGCYASIHQIGTSSFLWIETSATEDENRNNNGGKNESSYRLCQS